MNDIILTGRVTHGSGIGKKEGIPTANLDVHPDTILPKSGVYATLSYIDEKTQQGITNIGPKPTVDNSNVYTVETLLFDFDDDIYGKTITIKFLAYIREIKKFDSMSELKSQIENDKLTAKKFLENVS